ncbi:amino-acid transporter arg-13 [Ascosphaera apis ARSEF 7405]|uniref:Amino-acid transporter arg-13 n=1 Tax=Ascosphaera apis ARSEF 7405 TaxID=392613 RepID=A0A162I138_9EURO|nr:amino-acid transporter arg-13 [Ascosphaera apis ARSEF 7405]
MEGFAPNIPVPMENVPAATTAAHISEKPPQSTENASLEAAKDIIYGSIAGITGKLIEYPFDTIKVRLQSQPDGAPLQYRGPLDCFQQSFRSGGIYSLYRGIGAPMFGAAVETSGLFFSYRFTQDILQKTVYKDTPDLPLHMLLFCGSASGAFISLLLTPVELVKCKMQVPGAGHAVGDRSAPGPVKIISQIFKQEGILGFWRGQLGTFIRETGGSASWFGAYEGVSLFFKNKIRHHHHHQQQHAEKTQTTGQQDLKSIQLPVYQQMLAGAAAGVSYNFTFYPVDTIKSRLQTEDISRIPTHDPEAAMRWKRERTFWKVGKTLYRERGVRGLYQGCGITCVRAAPSSAFIFTVFEALRYYIG